MALYRVAIKKQFMGAAGCTCTGGTFRPPIDCEMVLKTVTTMLAQETRSLAAPKPAGLADRPGPVISDTIGAKNGLRRKSLEK
jgi:hypothetical protein